jgi:hypothetical protein
MWPHSLECVKTAQAKACGYKGGFQLIWLVGEERDVAAFFRVRVWSFLAG